MHKKLMSMMVALSALALLAGCGQSQPQGEAQPTGPKAGAVKVELFVMSKCPYGVQAVDGIGPVIEKFGADVDFKIDYIGSAQGGEVQSMHGPEEVDGNILQLCAMKLAPQGYLKFLLCQNKEWRGIPAGWEACATEAKLDVAKMKECKDKDGKQLLTDSFKRAETAGAQGSPTIKINGKIYEGGRRDADFTRAICDAAPATGRPALCNNIPAPAKVNVIALTDKRCKECAVEGVIGSLKQPFPGLEAKVLDYADPAAQAVFAEAGLKKLPAVLFDESLSQDPEGQKQIERWLEPAGKYKSLRIQAEFDPKAEICDNGIDDTADGTIDCADATCVEALACRPAKPGSLEVFVMSQCPFGVKALDSMKAVLGAFGKDVKFAVHFIGAEGPSGFESLHGPAEVAENLREICAQKYYAKDNKFMDYIWCRNQNIQSPDWQPCATGAIKAAVIEKCSTGEEGKKLLSDDPKIAAALKIGASPTWLVNNRVTFNGLSPADIQGGFCAQNKELKGCATPLSAEVPGMGPAPQGGGGAPAPACGQ